ncbi:sugar lactone lactonase YvrE [Paucibacter oligotrophus]|uniref:Sugar lactone lactonase YvrE n=1 Tax=Roseateles oligotrophus TaxID=1769250 RepID=A0A840LA84_9BURK|nr:SMP-30/gluconolactonase/LRE family protein [Roseateles oligotrophus]MBB4843643.1 sugar lactone lactonase YvrE [Roseateles oligotrophus]
MQARCIWDARCQLGEGPVWHQGRLYFVDIHGAAVHAHEPASGRQQRWSLPRRIAWLMPDQQGDGFIAGLDDEVVRLQLEPTLLIRPWVKPPLPAGVRLNDAKRDRWGRIWAGSMHEREPASAQGVLACLEPDGRWRVAQPAYGIANGPTFSPDGTTLYHADSARAEVHAYAMDAAGRLGPPRLWRSFGAGEGVPDGMCTDSEGALWIAQWGGHGLGRYAPDGRLLARIDLPVSQVSSCCFGGEGGRQLYITTARTGLSEAALAHEPLAGALFVAEPPVPGLGPDATLGSSTTSVWAQSGHATMGAACER